MVKHGIGQVFHVNDDADGCTLASYLRQQIAGTSWAVAERWIRNRRITVHGNICVDAARRLKTGEVVKFLDVPAAAPPGSEDVKIVFLDDQVVVVEKPAGMTTTRHHEEAGWPTRRRQLQPTLDELLPTVIGRFLKAGGKYKKAVGQKKRDCIALVRFDLFIELIEKQVAFWYLLGLYLQEESWQSNSDSIRRKENTWLSPLVELAKAQLFQVSYVIAVMDVGVLQMMARENTP